jgi:hypothetical protein
LLNALCVGKTTRIWTLSKNLTEYENYTNMLRGEQKQGLSPEQINASLLSVAKEQLHLCEEVFIVHDGSDLRKASAQKMESLSKVRDLSGKLVNGYVSFNSIAISDIDQKIHLLSSSPYSYSESHYGTIAGLSYTEKDIIYPQIQQIDKTLKEAYPDKTIWHIFDRKHDDQTCFEEVDALKSKFIIRIKRNRNSKQIYQNEVDKSVFFKIKDQVFQHQFKKDFEKFFYKNTLYTQVKAHFEHDTLVLSDKTYHLLRVILKDRKGNNIFSEPMVLITNQPIEDETMAYKIFQVYLKRAKIEGVFKFLKQQLGWEDFQMRNFLAIQNIIALAFYIGAYFFEIEDEITKNYNFKIVCQLAKCKDKYTKHFFLNGLVILAHAALFQQFVKEQNLSQLQIEELLKMAPKIE